MEIILTFRGPRSKKRLRTTSLTSFASNFLNTTKQEYHVRALTLKKSTGPEF